MKAKGGYVYIVSNRHHTVYYIGVTANLYARAYQHKTGEGANFSKKFNCHDLIYYEFLESVEAAIQREKQLKKWHRTWKEELIKSLNPNMKDLFGEGEDMQ